MNGSQDEDPDNVSLLPCNQIPAMRFIDPGLASGGGDLNPLHPFALLPLPKPLLDLFSVRGCPLSSHLLNLDARSLCSPEVLLQVFDRVDTLLSSIGITGHLQDMLRLQDLFVNTLDCTPPNLPLFPFLACYTFYSRGPLKHKSHTFIAFSAELESFPFA